MRRYFLSFLLAGLAGGALASCQGKQEGKGQTSGTIRISGSILPGPDAGPEEALRDTKVQGQIVLKLKKSDCSSEGTPLTTFQSAQFELPLDGAGRFSKTIAVSSLTSGVQFSCVLRELNPDQISKIDLQVRAPATDRSCDLICKKAGSPASCQDDCLQSGGTIASESIGSGELSLRLSEFVPARIESGAPDLQTSLTRPMSSYHVTVEDFAPDSCAMQESCVLGPGSRKLIRFDATIQNLGNKDWVMGDPSQATGYEYASCHGHHHLSGVMRYELRSEDSGEVIRVGGGPALSRKQGFCLRDDSQLTGSEAGKYDCHYQGITAGWEDIYDASIDCQWLDVTGIPAGNYTLRITVNPEARFTESDLTNNAVEFPVEIPS